MQCRLPPAIGHFHVSMMHVLKHMTHVCMMHMCMICVCMFRVWSIYICMIHIFMMHMSLMRMNACIHVWCVNLWCGVFLLQTNGEINKPILGVYPDVCVYDAYIYDLWSLILTNVFMMHNVWCIYPLLDVACMNDACMYLYCAFSKVCEPCMYDACIYHLRPLTLVHVRFMRICMMHVHLWSWSLILMHACKYDACIYNAAEILLRTDGRTDGRTNGQGDSRSWMCQRHEGLESMLMWLFCSDFKFDNKMWLDVFHAVEYCHGFCVMQFWKWRAILQFCLIGLGFQRQGKPPFLTRVANSVRKMWYHNIG